MNALGAKYLMKNASPPPVRTASPSSDAQSSVFSELFVGRDSELAALQTGLTSTQQGHGQLFILVGEPGVGKTRLADKFASYARQQHALVLWGRCWEGDGAPAFWPWRRIIDAYAEQTTTAALLEDMGPGAADIAQIVPGLRTTLPQFSPPPELDSTQARFRVFDSVTAFFKAAGRHQPLVLIFDDLHWADRSSLQLLHFLARDLATIPVLLLGAYRDVEIQPDHPLSDGIARRLGDQATLAYVLSANHWALWAPENLDVRLALTQEIIHVAGAAKDFPTLLMGHTWRLVALLERGDIAAVDHQIQTVSRLAQELRQPLYLWWAKGLANMRALLAGRFADLEPHLYEALLLGERIDALDRVQSFGAQLAMLYNQQGRLADFAPAIIGFVEQYPAVSTWQCVLAHLYSELGQREDAQRTFAPLAAKQFTDIPADEYWGMSFVVLAETCWFLRDRDAAALLYERLLPFADRHTVAGPATVCYGSVARVLGLLATLLSRWEEAKRHFKAALQLNTRMDARSFVAQTLYNHAQMLRLRDRSEDDAKVRELLDQAFAIADELGM